MKIRACILDIDGVLYLDDQPIPGAVAAVAELRRLGYPLCFLTNGTMSSRVSRATKLRQMGFTVDEREILTASYLTAHYLRQHGRPPTMLLLAGAGRDEFADIPLTDEDPAVVAVGDMSADYHHAVLDRAFRAVRQGAELLAMQKNRCSIVHGQPSLDVGAWVALLEYATGRQAKVIGKPAPEAYRLALDILNLPAEQVVMVSDDAEFDLAGARSVGLRTILVESHGVERVAPGGERRAEIGDSRARQSVLGPAEMGGGQEVDVVLASIAELPQALTSDDFSRS